MKKWGVGSLGLIANWPAGQLDNIVVLASDYDALAAECNACKEWSAARIGCDARIATLEGIADARMTRIEELEELVKRELPFARAEGRKTWVTDAAHALYSTPETCPHGIERYECRICTRADERATSETGAKE